MKIKRIEIENHQFFGTCTFDFTDVNGNAIDNIVLAGENGNGKTQLLSLINDFPTIDRDGSRNDKITFYISLSDTELHMLVDNLPGSPKSDIESPDFVFYYDYSISSFWEKLKVTNIPTNHNKTSSPIKLRSSDITSEKVKHLFKSVFSTVEINFNPKAASTVTSTEIDKEIKNSIASSENLATEIQQLFIDIKASDAEELNDWVNSHEGKVPPPEVKNKRMNRFNNAFSFIFDNMYVEKIINSNGHKKVIFNKGGNEVEIASLSSGEKQIVFRGAFLLQNQQSIQGSIILIDEPELSMHPKWQEKIMDYYRNLFMDDNGNQVSQIFFATHSQYILSSTLQSSNSTIVQVKRNNSGIEAIQRNGPFVLPYTSIAELNYFIFSIQSSDYHNQLYGYLQHKIAQINNKSECTVKGCDDYIRNNSNYDSSIYEKQSSYKTTNYYTLPTYIRNLIDHPDPNKSFSNQELKLSIELLIELCK